MSEVTLVSLMRCSHCSQLTLPPASENKTLTEEALAEFLKGEQPAARCGTCGRLLSRSSCVICRDGFIGVVLGNEERLTVCQAADVVVPLLEALPDGCGSRQLPILVVGRPGQLGRVLSMERGERFNAVGFEHLAARDWVNQIESLKVLCDCYLQNDLPEQAFGLLAETCTWTKELMLHPSIYQAMELALEMSRLKGVSSERLALMEQDFGIVQESYQSFRSHLPPRVDNAHLCFFPGDSDFSPDGTMNYLVQLVAMDQTGLPDFDSSELHVTMGLMQAVWQEQPTLLEWAKLEMLIIGVTPHMVELLGDLSPADKLQLDMTQLSLALHWDLVGSSGRYELYKTYSEKFGGRDLVMDFNLPPKGIYMTIARMESGGDPRF